MWTADITYVRLRREFVYLALILDLFTRSWRGWHLSRSLDHQLALIALEKALAKGKPQIHHSVQYAALPYVHRLQKAKVKISMAGIGQPTQNPHVERLIRTIKETRSAEVRHRLRRILGGSKKTERFSPTDELRMRRIIHAAERAGGKQAEEILQMILENFPELHFGTLPDLPAASDAKTTLKRLRNPLRPPAGRR